MRRRRLLSLCGGLVPVAIAGCTDEQPDLMDDDLVTVRALPDPGSDWELGEIEPLAIGGSDATEGTGRDYVDPERDEYRMAVVKWPDEETAADRAETEYGDWTRTVSDEDLSFACNGPDPAVARDLLAASPKLPDGAV